MWFWFVRVWVKWDPSSGREGRRDLGRLGKGETLLKAHDDQACAGPSILCSSAHLVFLDSLFCDSMTYVPIRLGWRTDRVTNFVFVSFYWEQFPVSILLNIYKLTTKWAKCSQHSCHGGILLLLPIPAEMGRGNGWLGFLLFDVSSSAWICMWFADNFHSPQYPFMLQCFAFLLVSSSKGH